MTDINKKSTKSLTDLLSENEARRQAADALGGSSITDAIERRIASEVTKAARERLQEKNKTR